MSYYPNLPKNNGLAGMLGEKVLSDTLKFWLTTALIPCNRRLQSSVQGSVLLFLIRFQINLIINMSHLKLLSPDMPAIIIDFKEY